MAHSLTIDEQKFIPASMVGKHFGYTRDYIIILVREGKIEGQKVGARWYVSLSSARTFFASAKVEREVRRQKVSKLRKEELRSSLKARRTSRPTPVVMETLAVLIIGLLIGVTGYIGTDVQKQAALAGTDASFIETLARSVYSFVSPQSALVAETTLAPTAPATVTTTTYTSLVIAPDQVLTTTTIESIKDSFSDDVSVSVDPHNPESGVIIPRFKSGDGESYRFLMVPVTPENNL